MHDEKALANDLPPYAIQLAASVLGGGRLVIHAGAGISFGEPTSLPSGSDVARDAYDRVAALIGEVPDCDPDDILSVADALATLPLGLSALKAEIVAVAELTSAEPNYGHKMLALLSLEGFLKAMTTNWDDCIERAAGKERVLSVVVQDELMQAGNPLLKLHGCATRPQTIRITSEEIANPHEWVINEAKARLADSQVVFLGIGDPAAYVSDGLEELLADSPNEVLVVGPSIVSRWADSKWAHIQVEVPADNRIEASADEFLDALGAAYIRHIVRRVVDAVAGDARLEDAVSRVEASLLNLTALFVLFWFRGAVVPGSRGPVLSIQSSTVALIAIGCLGDEPVFLGESQVEVGGARYIVLIDQGANSASRFRRAAKARMENLRAGGTQPDNIPRFLVSATVPVSGFDSPVQDVVGEASPADLIDGPLAGQPVLIDAAGVIRDE